MKRQKLFKNTLWGIFGCMIVCGLWCSLGAVSDAAPGVIVYDRNKSKNMLAGRAATDRIVFSNGKSMTVGDIRRLQAMAKQLHDMKGNAKTFAFKYKPSATGTQVKTSADLSAALQRNKGNETLQVGSHLITVEQLKFLQPELEKRMGHKLGVPAQKSGMAAPRPNLTGPSVPIHADTDWKAMLNQPDSTVLETKNHKRITVGMLKQVLAQKPEAIPDSVRKSIAGAPASQQKQIRGR